MRLRTIGLIAVVLVGCGRIAFDVSDAPDGGDVDARADGGSTPDADASTDFDGTLGDAGGGDDSGTLEDAARPSDVAVQIAPPPFETASVDFVDIPGGTLVVPASPGAKWVLFVTGALQSSSFLFSAAQARYLVDGIERGLGGTESIELGRPGPWQHLYVFDGDASATSIVFQARDTMGATTRVSNLRAVAVRLPPEADPLYASSDALVTTTSRMFAPIATLSLAPATPGEYLVFLCALTSEGPGTSDIDTYWLDPSGLPWTTELKNPRGALQSQLWIRRTTLGGAATVELLASTRETATVQYVRALAIRTDAFPNLVATSDDVIEETTIAPTPIYSNEIVPTLSDAEKYLVVGTTRIDDDCTNSAMAARGAHFVVDAFEQVAHHVAGNCAYYTTYGFVGLLDAPPSRFAVGVSSGNGMRVHQDESNLVVLGVR